MKDFPQDPLKMIELLNRTAEETAVRVAVTADWAGLIAEAKACKPAPLREVLRQIGTTRTNLYPPEMLDFLALMEEQLLKIGRPRKDEVTLRAAARAWRDSYIVSSIEVTADVMKIARKVNKGNKIRASYKTEEGLIQLRVGSADSVVGKVIKRPYADYSATDRALQVMVEAGFGASMDSLKNKKYHRKKGTTKKSK